MANSIPGSRQTGQACLHPPFNDEGDVSMGFRRVISVLAVMAVCLTPACASKVNEKPLCCFEESADMARIGSIGSTLKLAEKHATSGRKSLRISLPQWQPRKEQWEGLCLTLKVGADSDWSRFDAVSIDLFNPSKAQIQVTFFIQDANEKGCTRYLFAKPNSGNVLSLRLRDVGRNIDLKHISKLYIYVNRPQESLDIYVDDLRLDNCVVSDLKTLGTKIVGIRRSWKNMPVAILNRLTQIESDRRSMLLQAERSRSIEELIGYRESVGSLREEIEVRIPRELAEQGLYRIAPGDDSLAEYSIGFAPGMERVNPKDLPFTALGKNHACVELARNETEPIQLLIHAPARDLRNVKVEVLKVAREDGTPAAELPVVTASPVGFIKTEPLHNWPEHYSGWYADPILDYLDRFDVKQGDVQPVWINVKSSEQVTAGTYHASLRVTPENGVSANLTLTIKVWDFAVPNERHMRTATTVADEQALWMYHSLSKEMRKKLCDLVIGSRFNPDFMYRRFVPDVSDLREWDRRGMNAFSVNYVNPFGKLKDGEPYPADQKADILRMVDEIVPKLKAAKLYDKSYVYGFDETGAGYYPAMKDIFGEIKSKYPDLKILTTARDYSYGRESGVDAVDAWCPLTPDYDLRWVKDAHSRGKQVWFYVCLDSIPPYAEWILQSDLAESRSLTGLQLVKYQPDGFLYYFLNLWTYNYNNARPITGGPYTDWPSANLDSYDGEGNLIYPGPDRPLSSIRLENARDGFEDYEYFWVLKSELDRVEALHYSGAADTCARARKALTVEDRLVKDLAHFSRSPEAIYAKRRQVAEAILELKEIR